ncbi:MAG: pentapeptide repeat-containing protein [Rothia mucilaginosa]|uniref:pentapeptide repeat-containing protein n=1 Tax=Rothia mucilaginosa TaxID=43675 RepID=UPI001CAC4132|nr:pentapeptide repeat-containing protein [Rothia mucilaginosa]MBF1652657.1 pentapeptide repeat-containing protein [Rothia mucilaginosa]
MSEQDNSPETSTSSPKSPSTPEKRFSLSKLIENIMLLISGAAFIISLFSKGKNTETKESHKDTQTEIKEPHKETEQHQKTKEKRKGEIHKNIFKDTYKAIPMELRKKLSISLAVFFVLFIITNWRTEIFNCISPAFKYLFSENIPLGISISVAIIVALSLIFGKLIVTQLQKRISSLTNKYFISTLTVLALLGGATALLIPSYTNLFREPGYTSPQQDSTRETPEKVQETPTSTPSPTGNKVAEVEQKSTSDLRLHLLYITGGIIAILGLIETNRKNSQDHIRQVHAARRERYIEAVDKLYSKNAPVRLGGVYALVGLADEWLDDDNIDRETRVKEGQVIINNLCSYIRSPFPLAEKIDEYKAYEKFEEVMQKYSKGLLEELDLPDWIVLNERFPSPQNYKKPKNITKDYATFSEEQNVRRTIFDEMSKRSSTFTKNEKGEIIETISGMWSDFDFDFSRAPVFYSLGDLTIEKGNFSTAKFYFYAGAHFNSANFIEKADFLGATFIDRADFANVTFAKGVDFSWAEFSYASFYTAKFIGKKSYFTNANFSEAIFFGARFSENAIFCRATFTNKADFLATTFTGSVNFSGAVFDRTAVFADTTFTSAADFSGATFTLSEPHFTGVTTSGIELKARFSAAANPQDYIFSVASGSKPINRKPATLLGKTFNIPLGTVLFDPDSPKDQLGNYAVQSDPAQ